MKITVAKAVLEGVTTIQFNEEKVVRFERIEGGSILAIPAPAKKNMNRRRLITLSRRMVQTAKQHKLRKVAIPFESFSKLKGSKNPRDCAALVAQNFVMASYDFTAFKTPPKEGYDQLEEVILTGNIPSSVKTALERGVLVGEMVNATRTLANTPGGDMTPKTLATETLRLAKNTKVKVKILGREEMEKFGMGAILGVARGSSEEPQFIIAEYWGGRKRDKPTIFIGKGVTFDTGGINLKPEQGIHDMHLDMSGGAAVIASVVLAAKLGVRKNLIALVPAVENMPSGSAYRPGDILKSLSGKTIEVLNTDAEGRVILADAITYAKRYNPKVVIDVATLTGAALVALGQHASAVLTRNQSLERLLVQLGEESGDYLWPLPMWDEYEEYVKGNFGDVANLPSSGNSRYGGVINGGMFLWQFAKELSCPWAHLDIAPRTWTIASDALSKGAAGAPVRLLLAAAERL